MNNGFKKLAHLPPLAIINVLQFLERFFYVLSHHKLAAQQRLWKLMTYNIVKLGLKWLSNLYTNMKANFTEQKIKIACYYCNALRINIADWPAYQ